MSTAPPRLRRTRSAGRGVREGTRWLRSRFRPTTDPPWLEQLLEGEDEARESQETTLEIHHHWFAHARAALYRAVAVLCVLAALVTAPRSVEGVTHVAAVVLAGLLWPRRAQGRGRGRLVDRDVFSRGMTIACVAAATGLYAYAAVGMLAVDDPSGLLLVLAPVAWARGEWLWQATSSDVLFVTTKRVFKVNSFLSKTMGAMPLRGLVDLTVHQPVLGRVLGYGHLTFESAAQRQGLDKFHYVGDPLGVSKQIQARAYGGGPVARPRQGGSEAGQGPDEASYDAHDQGGDGVSDVSVPAPRREERIKMLSEIVPPESRRRREGRTDPRRPWSRGD